MVLFVSLANVKDHAVIARVYILRVIDMFLTQCTWPGAEVGWFETVVHRAHYSTESCCWDMAWLVVYLQAFLH